MNETNKVWLRGAEDETSRLMEIQQAIQRKKNSSGGTRKRRRKSKQKRRSRKKRN